MGMFLRGIIFAIGLPPLARTIPVQPAVRDVEEVEDSSHLQPVEHVVNLKPLIGTGASSRALQAERTSQSVGMTPVTYLREGAGYGIDVQFGRERFTLIFDTGSSDMWLPTANFECVGPPPQMQHVSQDLCGIGKTCDRGFSRGKIADQNFNISYGSGEFLVGEMGYETVTIGGVTVPKQEAALVDYGFWLGDKSTSGIAGFGYALLTSAYPGTDPSKDDRRKKGHVKYSPFIFNAIDQGQIKPMFGYAFDRRSGLNSGDSGGQIALGGVPDVGHGPWTSTPLRAGRLSSRAPPEAANEFSYYTIHPDGFVIQPVKRWGKRASASTLTTWTDAISSSEEATDATQQPMIVDSGTTVVYLPFSVAKQLADAMNPPAKFDQELHLFQANCNAAFPNFGVKIGGQTLWMQREDLMLTGKLGEDPSQPGVCNLGVQAAPGPPYVLGATFLRGVVTVHDVGKKKMWFSQRKH